MNLKRPVLNTYRHLRPELSLFSPRYFTDNDLGVGRRTRRQRGGVARAPDLQFGGPEFKSHPDRYLNLFPVVPSSDPRLRW